MKKLLFIPAAMIAATLSLAAGADAHTPSVQPSCSGLAESFSLYEGNATNNRVTTTIDGAVSVADFGGSYSHTFAWSQTVAHVWSVVVDADRNSGNATQYDTQFSGTWQPCQTPPTTTIAPTTTTTTVPPTTTTVPVTTTTVGLSPSGSVGVTCESLTLAFSGYGGDASNNRITMQIDGATPWYITFGDHYQASFANTDQTHPHTWTVFVDANRNTGDPSLYDHTYTGTQDACTSTTVTTVAASLCTYDLALPADSPLCLPPATVATVVVPVNAIATSDRLLPLTGPRPSNTGLIFAGAFALLCGFTALRVARRP